MSKRGSRNAINFAGKNWGGGRTKKTKNNQKWKKDSAETQFTELCQKFGYNITKNPLFYAELEAEFKSEFLSLKATKRKEILKKATLYKKYCKKNNVNLNIYEYLTNKLYDKSFYSDSEKNLKKDKKGANTKEKNHKIKPITERKKHNSRPILLGGKISDFLTDEIIKKLKNLNKK